MGADVRRDAASTRRRILAEASSEFARRGFGSARVDAIAARTATTKRMIYYYFGSKEGLFSAVLEDAFSWPGFAPPPDLDQDGERLDPVAAIRWLVQATFDLDEQHPDRLWLLAIANVHSDWNLTEAQAFSKSCSAQLEWLRGMLESGAERGLFRADADAMDLIMVVAAQSAYRITHRPSTRAIWNVDLLDPAVCTRQKDLITDMILAYLRP